MVNVQFNESDLGGGVTIYERLEAPKKAIIGFLISKDIVKDERQANAVLIAIIVVCLCLIIFFLFFANGGSAGRSMTSDEIKNITTIHP